MKPSEISRLSLEITQKYYQNDLRLFFEYVDEDILWYGPAKGQFLSGRQAVIDAWAKEKNPLSFSMGSARLDCASTHPSYCEVMMSFPVTTHFPGGESILMNQIIHITWCERKVGGNPEKQPRMRVIHISDLYNKHEEDNIYPVHFDQIYKGYMPVVEKGRQIFFRGLDHADYYLLSNSIQWIESTKDSRHAVLHTDNGTIEVTSSVREIETEHSDLFLRCHLCYLVNPQYVKQVSRFRVVLENGTELPIPEKKYSAFRKKMNEYRHDSH